MDYLHHLLMVYAVYVIGTASPGPSNMTIMAVAMQYGRRSALTLAAGVMTGSLSWAAIAATGLSAVLAAYADALLAIKICGGLYLLYLAWKSGRAALRPAGKGAIVAPNAALYRRGLLMHLTNPKAIMSWLAVMSLGLQPDSPGFILPAILAGCAALGIAIFGGYAVLFSTAPMVRAYTRMRRWIEGSLACLFSYAGLRLLLSRG
ncbi:MAG: LysE family translocator [Proteobacteria bacterium]|nr:LysE family translocator [Pseudomonadota bacterium]